MRRGVKGPQKNVPLLFAIRLCDILWYEVWIVMGEILLDNRVTLFHFDVTPPLPNWPHLQKLKRIWSGTVWTLMCVNTDSRCYFTKSFLQKCHHGAWKNISGRWFLWDRRPVAVIYAAEGRFGHQTCLCAFGVKGRHCGRNLLLVQVSFKGWPRSGFNSVFGPLEFLQSRISSRFLERLARVQYCSVYVCGEEGVWFSPNFLSQSAITVWVMYFKMMMLLKLFISTEQYLKVENSEQ